MNKFANHREWRFDNIAAQLTRDTVWFHGAITRTIPSLIKLLESRDKDVQQKILELIDKFANHSEWMSDSIAAPLTRMTKSGFVKPS